MKDTRKKLALYLVVLVGLAAMSVITKFKEAKGPKFESVEHVLELAQKSEENGDKNTAFALLKAGARQYRGSAEIEASIRSMKAR